MGEVVGQGGMLVLNFFCVCVCVCVCVSVCACMGMLNKK
jgi:hypothetical protein